jgi:hypothetical protein
MANTCVHAGVCGWVGGHGVSMCCNTSISSVKHSLPYSMVFVLLIGSINIKLQKAYNDRLSFTQSYRNSRVSAENIQAFIKSFVHTKIYPMY